LPRSAVILPVRLPPALEELRRRRVPNARLGVPSHVTLLYPFVPADEIEPADVVRLRDRLQMQPPFAYRLERVGRWPDAIYLAPEPETSFDALAAALAADWPRYPLYGTGEPFAAHVTIAEPGSDETERAVVVVARAVLPAARRATQAVLLAETASGRWRIAERLLLGGEQAR